MRRGVRVLPTLLLLLLVAQPPPTSASNQWSDTDPMKVVTTPAGNAVPIYVDVGVETPADLPLAEAASISWTVQSVQGGTATQVTLSATVPCSPVQSIGCQFRTRLVPSSQVMMGGTVYAQAFGFGGKTMVAHFTLPYP